MEDLIFKIINSKNEFSDADIHMLLVLCKKLFERNEEISLELGTALEKIDRLTERIEFYRNATMRGVQ